MIYFLKGKIMRTLKESIVININNVGYEVFVSRPYDFTIDNEYFLYTQLIIKEDTQYIVGFISLEEKQLFINLLKINGLGPKTILNMFRSYELNEIIDLIAQGNVTYLAKIPGISNKLANQIIFELQNKMSLKHRDPDLYKNLEFALREIGYKKKDVDAAIKRINTQNKTLEELIKDCLSDLRGNIDEN